MMKIRDLGWRLLRRIYGAFYMAIGIHATLVNVGILPRAQYPTRGSAEFMDALRATGFVFPLMIFGFIVAGVALLFERTTPLGLVIIAPFATVIFFTNVFLDSNVLWGFIHLAVPLILAWRFRDAFAPLWTYSNRNI